MPAYFESGFSVRQPMWHGQGLVLDDYPTDWNDARAKAGLLWEPEARQLYAGFGEPVCKFCQFPIGFAHEDDCLVRLTEGAPELVTANDTDLRFEVEPDHKRIVRSDTGATLGVVGQDYVPISHETMGEILEAILDEGGQALKFETAGSVKGGAAVWALAYLDEPVKVAGDDTETYPYLTLLNGHDSRSSCKLLVSSVRVVCWNTYQAASMQGDRHGHQYTFRHTANVMDRIAEAKEALKGVRKEHTDWIELANELALVKADETAFNHFLSEFIPEPPAGVISERVRENVNKAQAMFKSLYLDSPTTEGHRGTALGLVDASVEYLDHVRGFRNQDTYLGRTLLRPEPLKAKAVTLARRVCNA